MWNDEDFVCAKFKEFEACRAQLSSVSAVCCCYFSRRFINKNCEEKKKVHSYIFIQSPHLSHLVFLLSLPFLLSCARVFFPHTQHTIHSAVCMDLKQERRPSRWEEKPLSTLTSCHKKFSGIFFDSFFDYIFFLRWWKFISLLLSVHLFYCLIIIFIGGWISKNTIISELNIDGMG